MAVDERRRLALHRAAAGTWGEKVADTLAELVEPSGDELATRADIQELSERFEDRFDGIDRRFDVIDRRSDAIEQRFTVQDDRWDLRIDAMVHRIIAVFERGMSDARSRQTRTLVFSQLGALVVIAVLAFGLR